MTAPAGTLVLETGLDAIADEPSYVTGVERTRWDGPLLRLVYSPAANVELDVEWVARVGVAGEEGRGDIQSSDWGDVDAAGQVADRRGEGRVAPRSGPASASSSRRRRSRTWSSTPSASDRTPCGRSWRACSPSRSAAGASTSTPASSSRTRCTACTTSGTSSPTASPSSGPRRPASRSSPRWRGGPATAGRAPRSAPRPAPECASAAAACGGTWRCGAAWRRRTARGA